MGTNYYIKDYDTKDNPKNHLGKRVSIGNKKTKFVWATDVSFFSFFNRVKLAENSFYSCILNEYGDIFSITEFLELALKCDKQDISSIGKEFS